MKSFFSDLFQLISFVQITKPNKRIVFYSEGKDTWVHMRGTIEEFLKIAKIDVCYISSDMNDPGLKLKSPNYKSFIIRPGHILNWLFSNIETDVMVMSTPDLNNFQLKISKHDVHYIYMQHSLVSLHMAYQDGAFDYYQTIFCAGPHHIEEMRLIEEIRGLKAKNLVKHGYSKIDKIIKEHTNYKDVSSNSQTHVLVAPSWGINGIVETIGDKLIEKLLGDGFRVTLRPHPQTIKLYRYKVDEILKKYKAHPMFNFDSDMSSQISFDESDLMISDWSGAAFEYAFGQNKPVLFIDVPRKINNSEYIKIKTLPLEVKLRSEVGAIISLEELGNISDKINDLLLNYDKERQIIMRNKVLFNIMNADKVSAQKLQEIINGYI